VKNVLIFILPSILLLSCMSSTRLVKHTKSSYDEINQELNGKEVTLIKRNREVLEGDFNGISKDTIIIGNEAIVIENDIVLSSGLGGVFPKGLIIGGIDSVVKDGNGMFKKIKINPSVNFSKLEEVFVLDR